MVCLLLVFMVFGHFTVLALCIDCFKVLFSCVVIRLRAVLMICVCLFLYLLVYRFGCLRFAGFCFRWFVLFICGLC